jgi:NADH:ubiquinone oxidoreductase subunit F (NADH-binding)
MGFPLKTLLFDWAGVPEGRSVQAVTMAGLSGGFLGAADLDATLDEACLRGKGSFLGAGGIMVFDDRRDMFEIARQSMEFFASEACGKCFPCRIGTERLTERLSEPSGPLAPDAWIEEVHAIGHTMTQLSACGLGKSAPLITESLMRLFPEQVSSKLEAR